ncbi:MAG: Holliday junction resolvase RuvX [Chlorobiaceae bacterium]
MSFTLKKKVLAIDYGTKRIGVACSDPFGLFAQPVGTFGRLELFKKLEAICLCDNIEKIIVGYPLSETGQRGTMIEVIDRFIEELQKAFPAFVVETFDEHYSSRDAGHILIASGKSRKERRQKGRLDSTAACIILREYLESHTEK